MFSMYHGHGNTHITQELPGIRDNLARLCLSWSVHNPTEDMLLDLKSKKGNPNFSLVTHQVLIVCFIYTYNNWVCFYSQAYAGKVLPARLSQTLRFISGTVLSGPAEKAKVGFGERVLGFERKYNRLGQMFPGNRSTNSQRSCCYFGQQRIERLYDGTS